MIDKIHAALTLAGQALEPFTPGAIEAQRKAGGDPVTAADLAVNAVLEEFLPEPGDGWLSEETADNAERLERRRVWVVDPVDGTKEFVMGLPEWCVSIGLVEDGEAVAGGIYNPAAGELIVGARGEGVTLNGVPVTCSWAPSLEGITVLASRSEVDRGQWEEHSEAQFSIRAMGSVAYKLGRVAAGLDPVTWTLVPKNEWDVAAGAALVEAAGGLVLTKEGRRRRFNQPDTLLSGFVAAGPGLGPAVLDYLGIVPADVRR